MLTDPNQRATAVKFQEITEISAVCWTGKKNSLKILKIFRKTKTVAPISLSQTTTQRRITTTKTTKQCQSWKNPKTVYPTCETCGKTNHSTKKCYYGTNAANGPPPRHRRSERKNQAQQRANESNSNENTQAAAQNKNWKWHVFIPEVRLTDRRLPNFQQSLKLCGNIPRRLIQLIYIINRLLLFNTKKM